MSFPEPIIDLQNIKLIRGKRYWRPFMEKYNYQVICEVGVFAGRNFGRMIEHKPKIAIGVDIWKNDEIYEHNDSKLPQESLDKLYSDLIKRFADKPYVKLIREYSSLAAAHFPDEYFDLIYIDGDHTYQGTMDDLMAWYPKLKKGKFFTGDDYNRTVYPVEVAYDVKGAVNDFCSKINLDFYEIPGNEWATGWAAIK